MEKVDVSILMKIDEIKLAPLMLNTAKGFYCKYLNSKV